MTPEQKAAAKAAREAAKLSAEVLGEVAGVPEAEPAADAAPLAVPVATRPAWQFLRSYLPPGPLRPADAAALDLAARVLAKLRSDPLRATPKAVATLRALLDGLGAEPMQAPDLDSKAPASAPAAA